MAELEQLHHAFLGIEPRPPTECAVALVSAPYDGTASYRGGARDAPEAIIQASQQLELYDAELRCRPCDVGVYTAPSFVPDSAAGPAAVIAQVEEICGEHYQDERFVVLLGGEHSVTLGNARACAARHGRLGFLQIDAHLDLRDSYQGSRWSHACVARRLLELGRPVPVGARVACEEEIEALEAHGIHPVWAEEIEQQERSRWIARVLDALEDPVYVTLDVDGLDPAVIPSTGTPVPGGIGWYDLLALLRAVGDQRRVVGCDLVELAPTHDHAPVYAAATLVYKMIGYFSRVG